MVGKPVGNDARNVRAPRGGTAILSEVFHLPPSMTDEYEERAFTSSGCASHTLKCPPY